MSVNQRIIKETQKLKKDPVKGISIEPMEGNPRYFSVVIDGPQGSPYEGGHFKLQLYLPEEDPMVPPKCLFMTKIYHPNIDFLGRICLDILKKNWSPALQMRSVLLSIQSLLNEPNVEDPLNEEVNAIWKSNKAQGEKTAREWTQKYAH